MRTTMRANKAQQILQDSREWMDKFLSLYYETHLLAQSGTDEGRRHNLADELASMYTYPSPDVPTPVMFPDTVENATSRALITRNMAVPPLFQLKLYQHKRVGRYLRAYVGFELKTLTGYSSLYLLRTQGQQRIFSQSHACIYCGGMGYQSDGDLDWECDGLGWKFLGEGVRPPQPPGYLLGILKLQRPENEIYMREYDSD